MKCKVLFLASFSLIIVVAKYSFCADGEAEIAAGKEGCRTKGAQKFSRAGMDHGQKRNLRTHSIEDTGQKSSFVTGMRGNRNNQ